MLNTFPADLQSGITVSVLQDKEVAAVVGQAAGLNGKGPGMCTTVSIKRGIDRWGQWNRTKSYQYCRICQV